MTPEMLRGMRFEIEKIAAPLGLLARGARAFTESPMRTAIATGGVGAAHGAYKSHQEGGSALGGAIRGGAQGAALGGGAAMAGRAYRDTRLLNPGMGAGKAVWGTVQRMGQGVKHFGQRQLHGATGAYADRAGEIGMRSTAHSNKKIDLLKRRLDDQLKHTSGPKADALRQKFEGARDGLLREGAQGDAAIKAGITSIPGVAKGLVRDPRGTGKALWNATTGGSRAGMAMGVGLPLALSAPDLMRGDESAQGGRSMTQKLVGTGAMVGGGMLTAGLPIIPQMAAGMGIDAAANRLTGARAFTGSGQHYDESTGRYVSTGRSW